MQQRLSLEVSRAIQATPAKIWQALVDPHLVEQYLFGAQVHCDWKVGSAITYTGTWQGKPYTDKGTVIEIVPQQLLHTTYLSGLSGKDDRPENYAHVIYRIAPVDGKTTRISIEQHPIDNEKSREHLKQNWSMVLDKLKEVVERI